MTLSNFSCDFFLILPFFMSFLSSLSLGKLFLHLFKSHLQSKVREYTPVTHLEKNNTPTMGGIFIIVSILVTSLIILPFNEEFMLIYFCLILFGAIGLYDDWCKINKKKGISSLHKFTLQLIAASSILMLWILTCNPELTLVLPYINFHVYIGYLLALWGAFVIVGTSNAVNLTDGLDGLATQSLIPNFLLLGYIAYLNTSYTHLTPFCLIVAGSLAGFLWYNRKPAVVFMGDVGSLPLGALLALIFLIMKKEWILPLSGIIFLLETVSVMLQLYCIKYGKKRIFKLAPFHHHLELSGWNESAIVTLFTIITCISCLLSLKLC